MAAGNTFEVDEGLNGAELELSVVHHQSCFSCCSKKDHNYQYQYYDGDESYDDDGDWDCGRYRLKDALEVIAV